MKTNRRGRVGSETENLRVQFNGVVPVHSTIVMEFETPQTESALVRVRNAIDVALVKEQ